MSTCFRAMAADPSRYFRSRCSEFAWLFLAVFMVSLPCASRVHAESTIIQQWSEELLHAISIDTARPTIHARNLFHLNAAMYDAWAAYDDTASQYLHHEKVMAADIDAARHETISFAAYNIILHRFFSGPGGTGPGRNSTRNAIQAKMFIDLGYDFTNTDTVGDSPAALGNRIAQTVINHGLSDGANESNNYNTSTWMTVNEPLTFDEPGTNMADPNRWQALHFLGGRIDQFGMVILDEATQSFLSPYWGTVTPFALTEADKTYGDYFGGIEYVYRDQGPPPQLGGATDAEFKENALAVLRYSSLLDASQNVMIDISPATRGNSPLGSYEQFGHVVNPYTGLPYDPQFVNQGDFYRVMAEFWADGPMSTAPPGHWHEILHDAVAKMNDLGIEKRIAGVGPVVDDLEFDALAHLAVGAAVHDAGVAAWNHKGAYDWSRPISAIRHMGQLGQSSDPMGPSYHPDGLPLENGLVEVITAETAMPGGKHEHLAGDMGENIGKIAVFAWRGTPPDPPFENPDEVGGVDWILAEEWMPYQVSTFVTPPFAGYVSGHSTFSRSAAEVLTALTGDPYFPGGMLTYDFPEGTGLGFEFGPSEDIQLQLATYFDASDQAALSRIPGGIHPPADDLAARNIGAHTGKAVWNLAYLYYTGQVPSQVPEPGGLLLLIAGILGVATLSTRNRRA